MPFTPFHFGPGLAFKVLGGRRFSFCGFAFTQVAIDVEPGLGMLRGADVLHGWTHSYAGATLIGAAVAMVTPALGRRLVERWNREAAALRRPELAEPAAIGRAAAWIGALVGVWSHVVLDSVMHADLRPFAPLATGNALLGVVSIGTLHAICIGAGLVGAIAWIARARPASR